MNDLAWETLLDELLRLEGDRLAMYLDAEGNLTVSRSVPELNREWVTILEMDVRGVAQELEEMWPVVNTLDSIRRRVLIHMAFNMEVAGLLAMKPFVSAVEFGGWHAAADEMLCSQWGKQDTQRARTLAGLMLTGA